MRRPRGRLVDVASTNQRLLELRANQRARQSIAGMLAGWATDELRAIKRLAWDTWGTRANIFVDPSSAGLLNVGYFTADDRHLPPQDRGQVIVARGRSHREITDQIRLWKRQQQ